MNNRPLYLTLLLAISVMVFLSLGGGVWGAEPGSSHWTFKLFERICHQIPDRSYSLFDVQMAVNSRCFGIFAGLWFGWLLIPLLLRSKTIRPEATAVFLFLAVMLQIIDYTGNQISFWENTNDSRALVGFLLGASVSVFLSNLFKPNSNTDL